MDFGAFQPSRLYRAIASFPVANVPLGSQGTQLPVLPSSFPLCKNVVGDLAPDDEILTPLNIPFDFCILYSMFLGLLLGAPPYSCRAPENFLHLLYRIPLKASKFEVLEVLGLLERCVMQFGEPVSLTASTFLTPSFQDRDTLSALRCLIDFISALLQVK